MRGFILLILFAGLLSGTVYAVTPGKSTTEPVFSGIWTGVLGQTPGSYSETYPFNLVINESGKKLVGFSKIEANGPHAVMSLSGIASGKNLTLTENRFIENVPPEGTYWVLKSLNLSLNSTNSSVLEGTWEDTRHDPLAHGTIKLSKCTDCRVEEGTYLIVQVGVVKTSTSSTNVSNVRFYTRPGCKTCDTIREIFKKNNITFEEINPDTVKGTDAAAVKKDFLNNNTKKIVPVIVSGKNRLINATDNDIKSLIIGSGFVITPV